MNYYSKVKEHVVYFFERKRKYTKRIVDTTDKRKAADISNPELRLIMQGYRLFDAVCYGLFYVIINDKDEYFTGKYGGKDKSSAKKRPLFTKQADCALFCLDKEEADYVSSIVRAAGVLKVEVRNIYLDYKNELDSQRFIITCEDKNGRMSFFREFDESKKTAVTCRQTGSCAKYRFRECLALIEKIKITDKRYKYSMLHDFEVNLKASQLIGYLKKEKPWGGMALSFTISHESA